MRRILQPMATDVSVSLGTSLGSSDLIWLGLEIGWRRRPSDLRLNTDLVESWLGDLPVWTVDDREITARDGVTSISLGDGFARFHTASSAGYQRITELIPSVLSRHGDKGKSLRAQTQAQYLRPVTTPFADLVARLASQTLNAEFLLAVGANLLDFAYLADLTIGDQWMQANFGPVRGAEIPERVSTPVDPLPEVALFLHVTSRWKLLSNEVSEADSRTRRTIQFGDSIIKRLVA